MRIQWLLLFLLTFSTLHAAVLDEVQYRIVKGDLTLEQIQNEPMPSGAFERINIGFSHGKSLWMRFVVANESAQAEHVVLSLDNPLLEDLSLYRDGEIVARSGLLHVDEHRRWLLPTFELDLPPQSRQLYYLHVQNSTTALQFALALDTPEPFDLNDRWRQFVIVLYVGMIIAFMLYAAALSVYTKERAYLYYILYIAALLFQQLTYLGFLPLYMPSAFTAVDNKLVVPKVAAMIITAALFARAFLKTERFVRIDRTYLGVIALSSLLIPLTGFQAFYYPEAIVLTGLFFIFFNLFGALYVYLKGYKQARFFIVGWSFLIVGYLLAILDSLGVYTIMYSIPMLVMIFTAIEALFLLLAFIDRVRILQRQADAYQTRLRHELETRNVIIQDEVEAQTRAIKSLYRELHHRVKNNLQIILSIIRMQHDRLRDRPADDAFVHLENRVNSIAKTHELLLHNDRSDTIDMQSYIEQLCGDIEASLGLGSLRIDIDAPLALPLRTAVYVGLIVNELVSNTIKHAKDADRLRISLHGAEGECRLVVADNGNGYDPETVSPDSLGLGLVNALATEQLAGIIKIDTKSHAEYDIIFPS